MSQSPTAAVDRDGATDYFEAIDRWSRLVQAGASHSGHERNCAYLNLDGERFADVSALSGLDFPDDARAVVPVDWDHDGDLDLWIANRTGPQLRLLRNDATDGNHFVSFRLAGRTVNRDAIGARVELFRDGKSEPLVRVANAGSGFLSQGPGGVHFGLGASERIDRVVVRWPGAAPETFPGMPADRRYILRQGEGVARPLPSRKRLKLRPSKLDPTEGRARAAVRLASRPPAPVVEYRGWDGTGRTLQLRAGRPALLNLWASWCAPCAAELGELARRRADLDKRGLDVLALSVDGLGDERSSEPAALQRFLRELEFPYDSGIATPEIVDKLELLFARLFGRHISFPVPVSFLVDGRGRLAAIYKGRVEVDDLVADIAELDADAAALRDRATPFEGRWYAPPVVADLGLLAREYLRAGYAVDAEPLFRGVVESGAPDAETRHLLGTALALLGQEEEAEYRYREALGLDPGSARTHRNLAALLAERGDLDAAIRHYRTSLEIRPRDAEGHYALAGALLRAGRSPEAVVAYGRALQSRPGWGVAANALARQWAAGADPRVRDPEAAVKLAEQVNRAIGRRVPELLDTLAVCYAAVGRFDDAVAVEREAVGLAREAGRVEYAAELESRLKIFLEDRVWIEPH